MGKSCVKFTYPQNKPVSSIHDRLTLVISEDIMIGLELKTKDNTVIKTFFF